jgi:hypothetical protein
LAPTAAAPGIHAHVEADRSSTAPASPLISSARRRMPSAAWAAFARGAPGLRPGEDDHETVARGLVDVSAVAQDLVEEGAE